MGPAVEQGARSRSVGSREMVMEAVHPAMLGRVGSCDHRPVGGAACIDGYKPIGQGQSIMLN